MECLDLTKKSVKIIGIHVRDMGAFLGANFFKKRAFCLLAPPKQMSFLTISNQGTSLGAIIAPNKGLE